MPPEDHDFAGQTIEQTDFQGQVFEGRADFSGCRFKARPDFSGAVFKSRVFFKGAVFEQGVGFYETAFERFVNFDDIEVIGETWFVGARFQDGLTAEGAVFGGPLRLDRAHFDKTSRLGPISATEVNLTLVTFERRVRLDIIADRIVCERSKFYGGVQFLIDARISIKDSELGPASLLAMHTGLNYDSDRRPVLTTLSGTDVSNLTVSQADLSSCKFIYAHNLDGLRVTADGTFGWTPRSARLSRRQIIADERRWRALHEPGARRRRLWAPPPEWEEMSPPKTAGHVSRSYRALRKAREEARDEPGAADFYYGEMEMRRQGSRAYSRQHWHAREWRAWLSARGEYALLWLYWAVSGYGLRAWRAFAALGVVVALAAAMFLAWGYPTGTRMDYSDSLRFTLRAATSLLRGSEQKLTATGEWIELVLRFLGPVLFGLAILALRGRIKR